MTASALAVMAVIGSDSAVAVQCMGFWYTVADPVHRARTLLTFLMLHVRC